jgi:hypothetical protein
VRTKCGIDFRVRDIYDFPVTESDPRQSSEAKPSTRRTIPVVVDKSHLTTIGERLYSHAVELVRELINNAFDADATKVHVTIHKDMIKVEDDGSGMDYDGLAQYFNVGSPLKRDQPKSPKYGRVRIGEFGIGKFAALTAGQRFEIYTQRGDFAAKVRFDKKTWEKRKRWRLPLKDVEPDPQRGDGSTVTISRLTKKLDPDEVAEWVRDRVPLRSPSFAVHINNQRLVPRRFSGYRIPILEGTNYGPVHGEVVILPASTASQGELGIEVRVKQVLVSRSLFGLESWGKEMARVRGEVFADFLPVTSDRSGFVTDSPEYMAFDNVMKHVMDTVEKALKRTIADKQVRHARKALKEALERIERALAKNPAFSRQGGFAEGEPGGMGEPAVIKTRKKLRSKEPEPAEKNEPQPGKGDRGASAGMPKPRMRQLNPRAIVRKVRYGGSSANCCLDHFGPDGPESFAEQGVIFINQDHPVYVKAAQKTDTHVMLLTRLLAQELALLADSASPREAFSNQSQILKDAYLENENR